ncbi:MAG: SGNH/GDSL hydrolase family protein [Gemmatimonadetes bacterium]|nr:SGNH/GDSL hydrolase family protein [Gemmatimonadota bacterium]
MSGQRARRRATALLLPLLLVLVSASEACGAPEARPDPAAPTRMRLAVLGNSDSHAFHDSVSFADGSPERGGPQRAVTFQWTEILERLRGDAIDQGAWGARGVHPRVARVAAWVGIRLRSPRKQDYAWNVAYSGARCANLTGPRGQVAQLRHDIARDPEAWRDGLVLFRIGINDLGRREVLERLSREADADAFRGLARECTDTILASVRTLRAAQPALRIVLVGILDNANWPPNFDLFKEARGLAAQRHLLDAFDGALRAFAAATPGVAFIDDRAAFAARWGSWSTSGTSGATVTRDYRAQTIGGLTVTLSQGDALTHAAVADGHAGTVFNAYWVQALVAELDAQLGTHLAPITDAELDTFVRGLAAR